MIEKRELTLRPRRLTMLGWLVAALIFVAGSAFLVHEDYIFFGWLGVVFFGLGAMVFAAELFGNFAYLKLTPQGFEIGRPGKPCSFKWSDVEPFRVVQAGRIKKGWIGFLLDAIGAFTKVPGLGNPVGFDAVGMELKPSVKDMATARKVLKYVVGYEGILPDSYGMNSQDLVYLLNKWRDRYARSGESSGQTDANG